MFTNESFAFMTTFSSGIPQRQNSLSVARKANPDVDMTHKVESSNSKKILSFPKLKNTHDSYTEYQ